MEFVTKKAKEAWARMTPEQKAEFMKILETTPMPSFSTAEEPKDK